MPAGWLQNYFSLIQTPNTFENRNQVVRYDLRIFTKIFSVQNPGLMSCFNSANRLWKEFNLSNVLFGKGFQLEPECRCVSDFAAQ